MSEPNTINMFIRDDRTLEVALFTEGVAGSVTPVNLTDAKVYFTVKNRTADSDTQALITKRNTAAGGSDAQILITDAPQGRLEIYIKPEDTDTNKIKAGTYVYDVQVVLANGKTYTAVRDKLILKDDVTKGK